MTTVKKQLEIEKKILAGLEKSYERLIEFKKLKGTDLVVMRDGKILRIKPEDFSKTDLTDISGDA